MLLSIMSIRDAISWMWLQLVAHIVRWCIRYLMDAYFELEPWHSDASRNDDVQNEKHEAGEIEVLGPVTLRRRSFANAERALSGLFKTPVDTLTISECRVGSVRIQTNAFSPLVGIRRVPMRLRIEYATIALLSKTSGGSFFDLIRCRDDTKSSGDQATDQAEEPQDRFISTIYRILLDAVDDILFRLAAVFCVSASRVDLYIQQEMVGTLAIRLSKVELARADGVSKIRIANIEIRRGRYPLMKLVPQCSRLLLAVRRVNGACDQDVIKVDAQYVGFLTASSEATNVNGEIGRTLSNIVLSTIRNTLCSSECLLLRLNVSKLSMVSKGECCLDVGNIRCICFAHKQAIGVFSIVVRAKDLWFSSDEMLVVQAPCPDIMANEGMGSGDNLTMGITCLESDDSISQLNIDSVRCLCVGNSVLSTGPCGSTFMNNFGSLLSCWNNRLGLPVIKTQINWVTVHYQGSIGVVRDLFIRTELNQIEVRIDRMTSHIGGDTGSPNDTSQKNVSGWGSLSRVGLLLVREQAIPISSESSSSEQSILNIELDIHTVNLSADELYSSNILNVMLNASQPSLGCRFDVIKALCCINHVFIKNLPIQARVSWSSIKITVIIDLNEEKPVKWPIHCSCKILSMSVQVQKNLDMWTTRKDIYPDKMNEYTHAAITFSSNLDFTRKRIHLSFRYVEVFIYECFLRWLHGHADNFMFRFPEQESSTVDDRISLNIHQMAISHKFSRFLLRDEDYRLIRVGFTNCKVVFVRNGSFGVELRLRKVFVRWYVYVSKLFEIENLLCSVVRSIHPEEGSFSRLSINVQRCSLVAIIYPSAISAIQVIVLSLIKECFPDYCNEPDEVAKPEGDANPISSGHSSAFAGLLAGTHKEERISCVPSTHPSSREPENVEHEAIILDDLSETDYTIIERGLGVGYRYRGEDEAANNQIQHVNPQYPFQMETFKKPAARRDIFNFGDDNGSQTRRNVVSFVAEDLSVNCNFLTDSRKIVLYEDITSRGRPRRPLIHDALHFIANEARCQYLSGEDQNGEFTWRWSLVIARMKLVDSLKKSNFDSVVEPWVEKLTLTYQPAVLLKVSQGADSSIKVTLSLHPIQLNIHESLMNFIGTFESQLSAEVKNSGCVASCGSHFSYNPFQSCTLTHFVLSPSVPIRVNVHNRNFRPPTTHQFKEYYKKKKNVIQPNTMVYVNPETNNTNRNSFGQMLCGMSNVNQLDTLLRRLNYKGADIHNVDDLFTLVLQRWFNSIYTSEVIGSLPPIASTRNIFKGLYDVVSMPYMSWRWDNRPIQGLRSGISSFNVNTIGSLIDVFSGAMKVAENVATTVQHCVPSNITKNFAAVGASHRRRSVQSGSFNVTAIDMPEVTDQLPSGDDKSPDGGEKERVENDFLIM